jgi:hypothetical protein
MRKPAEALPDMLPTLAIDRKGRTVSSLAVSF